ncbi:uncharacterized protein LOC135844153 [Planococcus citri]|uniref:uncharacterized protein LOC135844153 n=1 Tax=Planococcus citri TaxID=170843 RepID=UPI0031F997B3
MTKRKLPNDFVTDDEFEIDFIHKIPAIEGDEKETDAIEYHFDFSLRHIAAVNLLYSKCIEFMGEEIAKSCYRNCEGEIYFNDILLKHLYTVFPYFSGTRVKLSTMVTQVVKNVYNWIRHIDRTVFNIRCARQSEALDFVRHIVITSRGTVNYAKSAENLLTDPKFDAIDKLKIICVHCLERYVFAIVSTIHVQLDPKKVYAGTLKMIEFWKQCISSGDFIRSAAYKVNDDIYNAAGTTNTEALKFLWNKTNGEERANVLIKLMRRSGADFQCYLLSQINGDDQQLVFKNCGGTILNNIFEDFIWGSYLLTTAYHARNVIPSRQYYEFMKRITFCMQFDKNQCRNEIIFRQLWRYATKRIKDYIFRNENAHIFYWFRNEINAEYMLTLFSDASVGFKQNFILSNSCLNACMELIKNNNVNVLETIIRKTYSEDTEKLNFKQILLNDERCKAAICSLVSAGDRTKFDSTIRWFFNSDIEAAKYKKNFIASSHYLNVFKSTLDRAIFEDSAKKIIREDVNFDELDEKIYWFLTNSEEINDFKENSLAVSECFRNSVHELVKKEQYSLIEQLFCWCLPRTEDVSEYKANLYGEDQKVKIADLVFELLWKKDDFKSLDEFLRWCFNSNEDKINVFKRTVLSSYKEAEKLWGSLLTREEYDLAERLMKWCGLKTDAEIRTYKNELMIHLNLDYVTTEVRFILELGEGEQCEFTEADRIQRCHRLIRWFNPTTETYQKFRNMSFRDEFRYNKYCTLIRTFLEENNVNIGMNTVILNL